MKKREKDLLIDEIATRYNEIMQLLNIVTTNDNEDTPKRVAKSLLEQTRSLREDAPDNMVTLFDNDVIYYNPEKGNNSMPITLKQEAIPFSSLCSHHHLPFFGEVNIEYVPKNHIIGLSKFKRVIDHLSAKPQTQEELTKSICLFLGEKLEPQYLKVDIVECIHTCMSCRGVNINAKTSTSCTYGSFKNSYL